MGGDTFFASLSGARERRSYFIFFCVLSGGDTRVPHIFLYLVMSGNTVIYFLLQMSLFFPTTTVFFPVTRQLLPSVWEIRGYLHRLRWTLVRGRGRGGTSVSSLLQLYPACRRGGGGKKSAGEDFTKSQRNFQVDFSIDVKQKTLIIKHEISISLACNNNVSRLTIVESFSSSSSSQLTGSQTPLLTKVHRSAHEPTDPFPPLSQSQNPPIPPFSPSHHLLPSPEFCADSQFPTSFSSSFFFVFGKLEREVSVVGGGCEVPTAPRAANWGADIIRDLYTFSVSNEGKCCFSKKKKKNVMEELL